MTERIFRLVQGLYILLALYLESDALLLAYMVVIALEGLTNWRIPLIINRWRSGKLAVVNNVALDSGGHGETNSRSGKLNFEAERLLRLVIFVLLVFTVLVFPKAGWFFPWFIGAMLFMAGLTNVCPMMLLFRYLGFR